MRYFIIKEISNGVVTSFEVIDICLHWKNVVKRMNEWKGYHKLIAVQEIEIPKYKKEKK